MFPFPGARLRPCKIHGFIWLGAMLLVFCAHQAHAVPANPNGFEDLQPDGSRISLVIRGDERFHWMEDEKGFTVVRGRGWYRYARLKRGKLARTKLKVGIDDPEAHGLKRGLLPRKSQRMASASITPSATISPNDPKIVPFGTIKNLVVPIRFSNHTVRNLPSTADIDILFNAEGGDAVLAPTGSVRDYYLQNSYGQMALDSEVADWITVSMPEYYYANGVSGDSTLWEALREALDALDDSVDFSEYDANNDGYIDSITFIHSGYGAEFGGTDTYGTAQSDRIWSHRWSLQDPEWTSQEGVSVASYHISPALWSTWGSEIGRIGVIVHEIGHFFGLPDLYDVDGGGHGIGSFGLMANSWGFDGSQLCPPHFSPWSKMQLNWSTPQVLSSGGEFTLGQSATNNEYLVISEGYANDEYLIIENRQNDQFDCSLDQGGLAIWHIDETAGFDTEGYPKGPWPRNGKHYRVALAQADGLFDLETGRNRGSKYDLYRAEGVDAIAPGPDGHPNTDGYQDGAIVNTGHLITDISSPGPVMTFCLNGCNGPGDPEPPGGDSFDAPSGLVASTTRLGKGKSHPLSVMLSWKDNSSGSGNEDLFVVQRCLVIGKNKNKTCSYSQIGTSDQDTPAFTDVLDASGTYRYRVKARLGNEQSAYSNFVKVRN